MSKLPPKKAFMMAYEIDQHPSQAAPSTVKAARKKIKRWKTDGVMDKAQAKYVPGKPKRKKRRTAMITDWSSTDDEDRQDTRDRWESAKALRRKSAKTPVVITMPGSVEYEISTCSTRKVDSGLGKKPSLFGTSALPEYVESQRSLDIEIPKSWPDSVLIDIQKNNLSLWLQEQRKMTKLHKQYMALCNQAPQGQTAAQYHHDLNKAYLQQYMARVTKLQSEYKKTLSGLKENGAVFPNGAKSHAGTVLPTKIGKPSAKDKQLCQKFMCQYGIHNLQEFLVISQKLKLRGNNAFAQKLSHCASSGMFCFGEHKQAECSKLKKLRDSASYIHKDSIEERWATSQCNVMFPHSGYESFKPVQLPQVQFPPAALTCGATDVTMRTYHAPVIVRGLQDDAKQMCTRIMKKYEAFPGITEGYLAIDPTNPEYFRPTQAWNVLNCASGVLEQDEVIAAHSKACNAVDRDRIAGRLTAKQATHKKNRILKCNANHRLTKEWPIAPDWQRELKDDTRYTHDMAARSSIDAAPTKQEMEIATLAKQLNQREEHINKYKKLVQGSVRARDERTKKMTTMMEYRRAHAGETDMPTDAEFYNKLHFMKLIKCETKNYPEWKTLPGYTQEQFGVGNEAKNLYNKTIKKLKATPKSGVAAALFKMQREYCGIANRSDIADNRASGMLSTYPFDSGDTVEAKAIREKLKRMVVPRTAPDTILEDIHTVPEPTEEDQCENYRLSYGIIPSIPTWTDQSGSWPGVSRHFPDDAKVPRETRMNWAEKNCDKFYTTSGTEFKSVQKQIQSVCEEMMLKTNVDPASQAWALQNCTQMNKSSKKAICEHRRDELKQAYLKNKTLNAKNPWKLITYWHLACPDTFISDMDANVRCVAIDEVRRNAKTNPEKASLHKIWSQHKCNQVMALDRVKSKEVAVQNIKRELAHDEYDSLESMYQANIPSTNPTPLKKTWTDGLMFLPYTDPMDTGSLNTFNTARAVYTDPINTDILGNPQNIDKILRRKQTTIHVAQPQLESLPYSIPHLQHFRNCATRVPRFRTQYSATC